MPSFHPPPHMPCPPVPATIASPPCTWTSHPVCLYHAYLQLPLYITTIDLLTCTFLWRRTTSLHHYHHPPLLQFFLPSFSRPHCSTHYPAISACTVYTPPAHLTALHSTSSPPSVLTLHYLPFLPCAMPSIPPPLACTPSHSWALLPASCRFHHCWVHCIPVFWDLCHCLHAYLIPNLFVGTAPPPPTLTPPAAVHSYMDLSACYAISPLCLHISTYTASCLPDSSHVGGSPPVACHHLQL